MIDKQDTTEQKIERLNQEAWGELRPPVGSKYLKLGIILLLMLLSLGVGTLLMSRSESQRIALLEQENALLKAKIQLYSSTVDSIYAKLDSLGIKHDPKRNSSLFRGGATSQIAHSQDPKLRHEMETLEGNLVNILRMISPTHSGDLAVDDVLQETIGDIPSIYPTFGRISDIWGTRIHPITNNLEFHYGIDIANEIGTPIYATAAGIVQSVDFDNGYGKRVIVDHGNGYRTMYAHLYNSRVKEGETVSKGQIIAMMGNSGFSTGPHLHYEVSFRGAKMNPARYLNRIDRYAFR